MEKKTFKGTVDVFSYQNYWQVDGEGELRTFLNDEWDMEVTFTKKQPVPEVGGTCEDDIVGTCIIVAVAEDLVWLAPIGAFPEDNTGWIEPIAALKGVKPWQPA